MSATSSGPGRRYWHDKIGRHRITDPRLGTVPRNLWDSEERAYARHLEEHETEVTVPEPLPGDSDAVRALFDVVENAEKKIATARKLIIARRVQELEDRNPE